MNNFIIEVFPVIDKYVRDLCCHPYDLHPKGCPNFGKRKDCPPYASMFNEVYNLKYPVFVVINEFNLKAHIDRMHRLHPNWSDRQLKCVLYWQNSARKDLVRKIKSIINTLPKYYAETNPEAMGVNVTKTLHLVGIELEWPPIYIARQVALLAYPLIYSNKNHPT